MKCTVTIDNGEAVPFVSQGEYFTDGNGFEILYEIDGDKSRAVYKNGGFAQERAGVVGLKLRFAEGKETECSLGSGENEGVFTVYTRVLQTDFDAYGARVYLEYLCGEQAFALNIAVTQK